MRAILFTGFAGKTFHFSSKFTAIRFAVEWVRDMNDAKIIHAKTLKQALKDRVCHFFEE